MIRYRDKQTGLVVDNEGSNTFRTGEVVLGSGSVGIVVCRSTDGLYGIQFIEQETSSPVGEKIKVDNKVDGSLIVWIGSLAAAYVVLDRVKDLVQIIQSKEIQA